MVLLTKGHIVLAVALLIAIITGVYLFEDRQVAVAEGKAAVAAQQLTASKEAAAQSALQNAELQRERDAAIQQLTTANAQLSAMNVQLKQLSQQYSQVLANQKSKDTQMLPSEQANRWQTLVPGSKVAVLPDATGFEVDTKGGLDTLLQLESVPVLQEQLDDTGKQVNNDEQQIANDSAILKAERDKHASDLTNDAAQLTEAKAETTKVSADFNLYKKKARKRLLVVAVTAYIAGYLTNVFTKGGL